MRPSRNDLLIQALGLVLKERRLELKVSQETFADAAGLDRTYVTMMEVAKKQPSISVFWKLAEGAQLTASELAARVDAQHETLATVAAVAEQNSSAADIKS